MKQSHGRVTVESAKSATIQLLEVSRVRNVHFCDHSFGGHVHDANDIGRVSRQFSEYHDRFLVTPDGTPPKRGAVWKYLEYVVGAIHLRVLRISVWI